MVDIIKEFKINNLLEDYNRFSTYFYHFQQHIDKCYENHLINISDRNNYIKSINDLIRQLNTTYNSSMIEIYEGKTENFKNIKITENNVNQVKHLVKIHKTL